LRITASGGELHRMSKYNCTVTSHLEIVPAGFEDYRQLAGFHYRSAESFPYTSIYALKDTHPVRGRFDSIVGVIVYTMPAPALELRNVATGGCFCGLSRSHGLQLVNENIRCIGRIIIEPRYRGLGLARRLVTETMPKLDMPIIESMAVMGRVNPFFEKSGMRPFFGKPSPRVVKLIEAFGMVGIEENEFIDSEGIHAKLCALSKRKAEFIEHQIGLFMQSYGKQRYMKPSKKRTRFMLSRLSERPVYYIWFNPQKKLQLLTNNKEVLP
jgi:GNAT superfamily N-acetyltransferase